jgi:voltage-gated potassium channel Kch
MTASVPATGSARDSSVGVGRLPLSPRPPSAALKWLHKTALSSRVPVRVAAPLAVALTLGLGTWGYLELPLHPRLSFMQALYQSIRLYTLDMGVAGGSGNVGLNWQVGVAFVLAALLVLQAVVALVRNRLTRRAMRHVLAGHVIVCGGGVHGSRLVRDLTQVHDVVLVDVDANASGLQSAPADHEWRFVGDAVHEETLLWAGAARANWVIAVTGQDFVNSQIVSAMRSLAADGDARDRVHVLVQLEDPALIRFLEREPDPPVVGAAIGESSAGAAAGDGMGVDSEVLGRPVISPFSANAIAADALLAESTRRSGSHSTSPLLELEDGKAPHLILAGNHPLIDAIVLAALRRWRVEILRDTERGAAERRPPLVISVYGPGAVERVEELKRRWLPEAHVLALEARDASELSEASIESDQWLLDRDTAGHAIVACLEELDGIRLTLGLSRALGNGVLMTRVTTQFESALDEHLQEHTARSADLATTQVKAIAELGFNREAMSRLTPRRRLADALAHADVRDAEQLSAEVLARPGLRIRSDSAWRTVLRERPMLQALLEPIPLSAFVSAGLRLDLEDAQTMRTAAERLSAAGEQVPAFLAWCEHVRLLAQEEVRAHGGPELDGAARKIVDLHNALLGDGEAFARLESGGEDLGRPTRVAILAGGAGSMTAPAARELKYLLERALQGYDGVILSGGTAVGLPRVVGEVARELDLQTIGYVPEGKGDPELYGRLRHTALAHEFSVLEPLAMWTDIARSRVPPRDVRLLACPGGQITLCEVALARALGARVAWIDPLSDAVTPLDELLPLGAAGVLELPTDAMTTRAFLKWSTAPEQLRAEDALARCLHADYRRRQRKRKAPDDPSLAPWSRLLPALQGSNRRQADDIPNKLELIGKRLSPQGDRLELSDQDVELLAEVEHGRFNIERLESGWKLGERQVLRGVSPFLRPWSDLDEGAKDYDREAVRNITTALESLGWGVVDARR